MSVTLPCLVVCLFGVFLFFVFFFFYKSSKKLSQTKMDDFISHGNSTAELVGGDIEKVNRQYV